MTSIFLASACALACTGTASADSISENAPLAGLVRTIVVSPVFGDPLASGTALRHAYAGVAHVTADAPVLLKLEPGTYDVGSSVFDLNKAYVHIEGSGQDLSVIRGSANYAVLTIERDMHLSRVTVQNTDGQGIVAQDCYLDLFEARVKSNRHDLASFASGISYVGSASGRIRDVIVESANDIGYALGIYAFSTSSAPLDLDRVVVNVDAKALGFGVEMGSPVLLNDVRVSASSIGLFAVATGTTHPVVTVTNSRIEGGTDGLLSGTDSSGTQAVSIVTLQGSSLIGQSASIHLPKNAAVSVAQTLVSGDPSTTPPTTLTCIGAYNAMFQPLDSTCQ
jgi:hypothetical protein